MKMFYRYVLALCVGLIATVLLPQGAQAGFNFEFQEFGQYTLSVDGGGSSTATNYGITINKPVGATVFKAYAITVGVPTTDPGAGALTFTVGANAPVTPNLDQTDVSTGSTNNATARWAEASVERAALRS